MSNVGLSFDAMANTSQLLTTREAAEQLGVSPRTLARWVNRGLIKAVRAPGGRRGSFLFEPSEVVRPDEQQRKPAQADQRPAAPQATADQADNPAERQMKTTG